MKKLLFVTVMLLLAGLSTWATTAEKTVFYLGEKPGKMPFSPAILVNGTLYLSGQLAVNPESGAFENGSMSQQSERIMKNMELLLKKAGFALEDVVSTTVYISDFAEFAEFNAVFSRFFTATPPTRATVQVSKLAREAKIEISAIAVK